MTDLSESYLRDLGFLLREEAFKAKEQYGSAKADTRSFESGRYMAYHEVISLMLSQAEAFGLPLSMLSLEGVDADRDLLS